MSIQFRITLAASIAFALGAFVAYDAHTPVSQASSATLPQNQVAALTATPRVTAPAQASWDALMHAHWR